MLRALRRPFALALAALATLAALAAPAGAQQLVDAGKEGTGGGLAFVLFVVMVFIIAGSLFFMDHVRRRRVPDEDDS
ncbi:MAG: hypothetical protein WEB19_01685 [Acidimicrobiia bacterium]